MGSLNKPITCRDLRRIPVAGGDVLKGLSATDPEYVGFGEAYMTWVKGDQIKGWKRHTRLVSNLIVPVGLVRFSFVDPTNGNRETFDLGDDHHRLLHVPPGYWMAFKALASDSLVLNLANMDHDDAEEVRLPLSEMEFEVPLQ